MNIFKRLLRIGQAEIHSVVDKMEDPVRMTEQGIREMREDLDKSMESLAQVRAMAIRAKNDKSKKTASAEDYQVKAIALLKKAQKDELELPLAEKLAKEALALREQLLKEVDELDAQQVQFENSTDEIQKNVEILKFNITKWENELKTLKAKVRVNKATLEVNKQMAQIDSNSTLSMLERMKEKVAEEENLALAYGELAKNRTSVDDEINRAIGKDAGKINQDLEEIKRELGML